jgi:hypothetical protein
MDRGLRPLGGIGGGGHERVPVLCPDGPADLPGAIGRAVLAALLPARRPRYSARK